MNINEACRLLARSRHAILRSQASLETLAVRHVCAARKQRLFELSNAMSREKSFEAWDRHLLTNDELHVLSLPSRGERGFQLWRFDHCTETRTSVLFGGKLRIGPELRGLGLSILMNLVAADTLLERAPRAGAGHKRYRVGLVNVHGLSALVPALESYQIAPLDIRWRPPLGPPPPSGAAAGAPSRREEMDFEEMHRRVTPMLHRMVAENRFAFSDAFEGRVDVGQRSLADPEEYTDRWWSRPGVRAFRRVVRAGSRDGNSRLYASEPGEELVLSREDTFSRALDAFIVFELSEANLASMRRYVDAKLAPA